MIRVRDQAGPLQEAAAAADQAQLLRRTDGNSGRTGSNHDMAYFLQ